MAAEIQYRHTATGATMRATVRKEQTVGGKAQMWNGSAWEDMTVANWANYIITLTETPASSYVYIGTMPAVTAGWYYVDIYSGTTISSTLEATMFGYWDGTTISLGGADARQFIGSALTETSGGYMAAGFKKVFDVALPVFTAASVNQTGDCYPSLSSLIQGAVGTINTVASNADFTLTSSDLSSNNDDYKNAWILFTSGNNKFVARVIGTYTGATKRVQLTGEGMRGAFPRTVQAGDSFVVLAGVA